MYRFPGLCIQTFVTVYGTKEYRPAEVYDVSRDLVSGCIIVVKIWTVKNAQYE
jgi:hypothetical protein